MSTEIDTGGAAFPHPTEPHYWPGLTLRDWFAGMALQGLMVGRSPELTEDYQERLSCLAYTMAEEMMLTRPCIPE